VQRAASETVKLMVRLDIQPPSRCQLLHVLLIQAYPLYSSGMHSWQTICGAPLHFQQEQKCTQLPWIAAQAPGMHWHRLVLRNCACTSCHHNTAVASGQPLHPYSLPLAQSLPVPNYSHISLSHFVVGSCACTQPSQPPVSSIKLAYCSYKCKQQAGEHIALITVPAVTFVLVPR
jgi:hypothetical protein